MISPEEFTKQVAALAAHAASNLDRVPQFVHDSAVWVMSGTPMASQDVVASRKKLCEACEQWRPTALDPSMFHCFVCKCLVAKLSIATSQCPIGKWGAV